MKYATLGIILLASSSVCFAGSYGTQFTFVNNSNYELTKIASYSSGMDWNFPDSISAKKTIQTRIAFNIPWFGSVLDDYGSVSYQATCPAGDQVIRVLTEVVDYDYLDGTHAYTGAGFPINSYGANCVSIQPASGDEVGFVQDSNSVLTIN